MNERIQELMLMAFQEHYGDPITPGAREKAVELVSGWGEKFAELIVRECAKFIENNSGYDDSNNAWHPEPEDLLKHFGVEE